VIFSADRVELASAITRAAQGLPSRPAQPVYAGLLLRADADGLHLTASDSEMRFTSRAYASVHEDGHCVAPGRLLADLSGYWTGEQVTFRTEGSQLTVASGRSQFTLTVSDGDIYPSWQEDVPALFRLDGEELAHAVRSAASSVADAPAVLTGILMEENGDHLTLVSTDHSRMAVAEVPFTKGADWDEGRPASTILPVKTGERFIRGCEGEVSAGWDDSLILLEYPGLRMTTRRIEGKFLPWRNVTKLNPEDGWVSVSSKELSRAVRVAQLATTGFEWVTFTFTEGELAVSAGQEGRESREYVECTHAGEDLSIGLAARFVLDGLAGCGDTAEMSVLRDKLFMRGGGFHYMIQSRREI